MHKGIKNVEKELVAATQRWLEAKVQRDWFPRERAYVQQVQDLRERMLRWRSLFQAGVVEASEDESFLLFEDGTVEITGISEHISLENFNSDGKYKVVIH